MSKKGKVAAVVGSSGLVGETLIKKLSPFYSKIYSFSRRDLVFKIKNVKNIIFDFDNVNKSSLFNGVDHLYITLGTTIKKAGSTKEFEKVDFHYCLNIAKHAFSSGIMKVSIVSSAGYNSKSKLLYPRTKGILEEELRKIKFECLAISKPGIILGNRKENRFGESIGKLIFRLIDPFLIGKFSIYKSIHAEIISRAMIYSLNSDKKGVLDLHYKELVEYSKKIDNL